MGENVSTHIANGYHHEIQAKVTVNKALYTRAMREGGSKLTAGAAGQKFGVEAYGKAEIEFEHMQQIPGFVRIPPGDYLAFDMAGMDGQVYVTVSAGKTVLSDNFPARNGRGVIIDARGYVRNAKPGKIWTDLRGKKHALADEPDDIVDQKENINAIEERMTIKDKHKTKVIKAKKATPSRADRRKTSKKQRRESAREKEEKEENEEVNEPVEEEQEKEHEDKEQEEEAGALEENDESENEDGAEEEERAEEAEEGDDEQEDEEQEEEAGVLEENDEAENEDGAEEEERAEEAEEGDDEQENMEQEEAGVLEENDEAENEDGEEEEEMAEEAEDGDDEQESKKGKKGKKEKGITIRSFFELFSKITKEEGQEEEVEENEPES